jgi:hypothetical protein
MLTVKVVTPLKNGVQNLLVLLDSGFRRNDRKVRFLNTYDAFKIE